MVRRFAIVVSRSARLVLRPHFVRLLFKSSKSLNRCMLNHQHKPTQHNMFMMTTCFRSAPHWKHLFEVEIGRSEKHVHTGPRPCRAIYVDCVFRRPCMSQEGMLSSSIPRYGWCSTTINGTTLTLVACCSL